MKIFYTLFLSIIILFATNASGQSDDRTLGAQAAALGRMGIMHTDVWSVHNNQGALGYLKTPEASVYYENRFLLKGLNQQGLVFAYPTKAGVFGLDINMYGDKNYRRTTYRFAYGMVISPKISLGIGLSYLNSRFGFDYGTYHAFVGEFGLLVKITPKWHVAGHVYNYTLSKFQPYDDERLPTKIRLGMGYTFSDQLEIVIGGEKDINERASFRAGINYRPIEMLYLRVGVATAPLEVTFGVGLNFKDLYIDLGSSWNVQLGYSPQISLRYCFSTLGKNPRLSNVEK